MRLCLPVQLIWNGAFPYSLPILKLRRAFLNSFNMTCQKTEFRQTDLLSGGGFRRRFNQSRPKGGSALTPKDLEAEALGPARACACIRMAAASLSLTLRKPKEQRHLPWGRPYPIWRTGPHSLRNSQRPCLKHTSLGCRRGDDLQLATCNLSSLVLHRRLGGPGKTIVTYTWPSGVASLQATFTALFL